MPDELDQCPRCGAIQQATGACRECIEESECTRLRERLFGAPITLELLTE